ncbi:serine/threonine-protein kinase [Stratiformator vulcanicus]|uniref:Serine/threonine-protein kinase PknB n=1 Tax=Stratiformator vulcanicus TaxID=2527980 RepID=A0A517R1V4_9PLAN|nr:protein kinase [Stratiformator vulcanicus]QDT37875.1 Serine/threonine-protein kinase PknB [Stratiformator vulcanicus]
MAGNAASYDSKIEAKLDQITLDVMKRIERGETVDRAELLAQHSDLADELSEFFDDLESVDQQTRYLKSAIQGADSNRQVSLEEFRQAAVEAGTSTLDDFQFGAVIARGGMASVFRAWQKSLERPVAVKVIATDQFTSPADQALIQFEASATARLTHPHIVPIYEVGTVGRFHYFTMKLLERGSLADRIPEYVGNYRKIAELMAKLAEAVQYAHDRGILHRDLKPSNVLIDARDEPCITDFGLAGKIGGSDESFPGRIIGTPQYMAPEQAAGTEEVTTAADVYSLGMTLLELLTGTTPAFSDGKVTEGEDVMLRLPVAVKEKLKRVPRDLIAICGKCLRFQPERRYGSAADLAEDIKRWLGDFPVQARRATAATRLGKWAKRRPLAASFGLISIFSIVAAYAGISWQWQRALVERDRAESAFEVAERRNYINLIGLADREFELGNIAAAREALNDCDESLRRWEWHYLQSRTRGLFPKVVQSHETGLLCVDVSSKRGLVVGGSRGQLKLSAISGKGESAVLQDSTRDIHAVAFDDANDQLLDTRSTRYLRIWRGDGSELLAEKQLPWNRTESMSVDDSTGRGLMIGGSNPDQLPIFFQYATWDDGWEVELEISQSEPSSSTSGQLMPGADAAIIAVGTDLMLGGSNGALTSFSEVSAHQTPIRDIAIASPINRIASVSETETVIWSITGQEPLYSIPEGGVAVEFLDKGQRLAVAGSGRSIQLRDVSDGELVLSLRGHSDIVTALAFEPTSRTLLTASRDRTVRAWYGPVETSSVPSPLRQTTVALPHSDVLSLSGFQLDRTLLAIPSSGDIAVGVCRDGNVRVWDSELGSVIQTMAPAVEIENLAIAPTEQHVVLVRRDRVVELRTLPALKLVERVVPLDIEATQLNRGAYWDVAGDRLITSTGRTRVIHRIATGDSKEFFDEENFEIFGSVGSPDGQRFAATDERHNVLLIDGTLEVERVLNGPTGEVRVVKFSPDGKWIAAGGFDRNLYVWEIESGRRHVVAGGHGLSITDLAFSPDGSQIATSSQDEAVRLWDTLSGAMIRELRGHTGPVLRVRFTANGGRLRSFSKSEGEIAVSTWEIP